jgi:hypothetical protein
MKCTSFMYTASNWLPIYYIWCVISWRWPPWFTPRCLKRLTKSSTIRRNSSWFVVAISSQISHFTSCIVCGQFLCMLAFKHPHTRSGTVSSGELTGHAIPDTWKCSPSLMNTVHALPIQVLKWHNISSSVRKHCPVTPVVGQECVLECQSALSHAV